jgi:hypothetical protein
VLKLGERNGEFLEEVYRSGVEPFMGEVHHGEAVVLDPEVSFGFDCDFSSVGMERRMCDDVGSDFAAKVVAAKTILAVTRSKGNDYWGAM